MALGKAVAAGMVAGAGLPLIVGDVVSGPLAYLAIQRHHVGTLSFLWSWPAFCVVTLAAWGLLAAAGERR